MHVNDSLTFDGTLFEQLYPAGQNVLLHGEGFCLELQTAGFGEWMVWNPGPKGARQMDDLPDDDWQRFVCIEPVRVSRPVVLAPEQTFMGVLEARLIEVK